MQAPKSLASDPTIHASGTIVYCEDCQSVLDPSIANSQSFFLSISSLSLFDIVYLRYKKILSIFAGSGSLSDAKSIVLFFLLLTCTPNIATPSYVPIKPSPLVPGTRRRYYTVSRF